MTDEQIDPGAGMSRGLTQTTARLLVRMARYRPVQSWLHRLASAYKQAHMQQSSSAGFEIPETLPIEARAADAQAGARLNLLVPAVSQQHVFGGIETALQVFDAMRPHFSQARIIVTDEVDPVPRTNAYYGQWPIITLDGDLPQQDHIVAAGARWEKTLAIHAQDYFMATAWWTAHNAFSLLAWQQSQYPQIDQRRLLYLIQDYEPGFYPWSSRYVLAQATYNQPERTIAVVNSHWLGDYLHAQGHQFFRQHVLHPRLHPALTAVRNSRDWLPKDRQLLVYGRPGTDRNAFSVIVATLRLWVQRYPVASQWQILSAGEPFALIDLGHGCQLQSVGKLSIEAYADMLSRTAVGISLMISPHPSYPPLEMAAFGARVLTNRFANKDLSAVSSYLVSVDQPDPAKLATALMTLTTEFDALTPAARSVDRSHIDWHDDFLQTVENAWAWTSQAAAELLAIREHTSPSA